MKVSRCRRAGKVVALGVRGTGQGGGAGKVLKFRTQVDPHDAIHSERWMEKHGTFPAPSCLA